MKRRVRRSPALALVMLTALPVAADVALPPGVTFENTPYNGLFTFVRARFTPSRWGPGNYMWGLDLKWNHDYPRADGHFMKILKETSGLLPNPDGNILAVDDPELTRYPVLYLCEPGFWTVNEKEALALRAYLKKGGFLILDDFVVQHWYNFTDQMRKVLPEGRPVELDAAHPIFDSFFKVDPQIFNHPNFNLTPVYYGIYEDNDPTKRLMVIANYNNDIGEYWEWSDEDFMPIELSNEAYKLGVNYVMYGLTH
jgi:Domain of unknown function (DUF4159)